MEISVQRVENLESWNTELESFLGSVFMAREWIEAISCESRNPIYLRFISNGEVLGILGGLELSNAKGTAKQLFFYSGIAARTKDPDLIRKLKLSLYKFAKSNNYCRVTLRSYDHLSFVPSRLKQFKVYQRSEYIVFLNKEKDEIFRNIDGDIKRRARKAKREGVVLKKTHSPTMSGTLLNLLDETRKIRQSKGYGSFSSLYIPLFKKEEIIKLTATGHSTFYYAESQNEILSIQMVFIFRGKAYELFEGTSLNGYRLNAPAFLLYEITQELIDQRCRYFNHGGIPQSLKHGGLKKFKEKIGASAVPSGVEVTDFITFPLNLLNPLLILKRALINPQIDSGLFKRVILKIINIILNYPDKY